MQEEYKKKYTKIFDELYEKHVKIYRNDSDFEKFFNLYNFIFGSCFRNLLKADGRYQKITYKDLENYFLYALSTINYNASYYDKTHYNYKKTRYDFFSIDKFMLYFYLSDYEFEICYNEFREKYNLQCSTKNYNEEYCYMNEFWGLIKYKKLEHKFLTVKNQEENEFLPDD